MSFAKIFQRKALLTYLCAGDPSLATTADLLKVLDDEHALLEDLIQELHVVFGQELSQRDELVPLLDPKVGLLPSRDVRTHQLDAAAQIQRE